VSVRVAAKVAEHLPAAGQWTRQKGEARWPFGPRASTAQRSHADSGRCQPRCTIWLPHPSARAVLVVLPPKGDTRLGADHPRPRARRRI